MEERSIFRKVHLARITAHVWAEASGTNTVQSRRKVLYAFHKRLKRLLKQSGTHYVVTLAPLAVERKSFNPNRLADSIKSNGLTPVDGDVVDVVDVDLVAPFSSVAVLEEDEDEDEEEIGG